MCIYCECTCQEEFTIDDTSTCSRDPEEFYNFCEICEGELESENELDDCDCYCNDEYDYSPQNMIECCNCCESINNYNQCGRIEKYDSLKSVEYSNNRCKISDINCINRTNCINCTNGLNVTNRTHGINPSNNIIEDSKSIQIKNKNKDKNNDNQNKKGSGKKRDFRFCNKEVTCLFRKHKYNVSVVPLPKGSINTEVISKPIRPKSKSLNKDNLKRPKMRIATSGI